MTTDSQLPSTETHQEDPQARKPRRILGIIVGLMLFFGAVVCGLGYYAYVRYLEPAAIKTLIETHVSQALGLPVSLGEVQVEFPAVRIKGLEIGHIASAPQLFASVGEVFLSPDFWDLLAGKVVFDQVTLSSSTVTLHKRDDGSFVLPGAVMSGEAKASGSTGISPMSGEFPLRAFSANTINLTLVGPDGTRQHGILDSADLNRGRAGGGMPFSVSGKIDSVGKIQTTGVLTWPDRVSVNGQVTEVSIEAVKPYLPKSVKIPEQVSTFGLKIKLDYRFGGVLGIEEALLEANSGIQIQAKADIASFSPLTGKVSIRTFPLKASVALDLAKPFLPADYGLVLEQGQLSGGGEFSWKDGKTLDSSFWLKPEGVGFNARDLPFKADRLQCVLKYLEGRVSWENLEFHGGGVVVTSSKGGLELEGFKGKADLKASIDLAKIFSWARKKLSKDFQDAGPTGEIGFHGSVDIRGSDSQFDGKTSIRNVRFIAPPAQIPVEIEKAEFTLQNLSRNGGNIVVETIDAKGLGNRLHAKGIWENLPKGNFSVEGKTEIDLARLQENLPIENKDFKGKTKLSGKSFVDVKLTGTLAKPQINGSVRLEKASFAIPEQGLVFDGITGLAHADMQSVTIEKIEAGVSGGKLNLSGTLKDFQNPRLQMNANMINLSLGDVRDFLARNSSDFPTALEFSGRSDIEVQVSGSPQNPNVSGSAILAGARLNHPVMFRPIQQLVGPITFDNKSISTENLTFSWGSSTARLKGKVEDISRFVLNFTYAVDPLDLTDLGGFFLAGSGYNAIGSGTGQGKIHGPIEKVVVEGIANVPAGMFEAPVSKGSASTFKFPLTELKAPFVLSEGIVSINGFKARSFEGTLEGSGKIFLKETPLRFSFDTKATQLMVQKFLELNTSLKNALSGGLDFDLKMQGNTTGLDSMQGESGIIMKNGKYQAPPVAVQIFEVLQATQLSAGDISGAQGKFIIKDGKMNSNDLIFRSKYGSIGYVGTVGLDTSLHGTANVELTQEACRLSPILQQLAGNQKTLSLPASVKGSLLSPKVGLKIEDLLKEVAKKKLQDSLMDALLKGSKKDEPSPASGTQISTPATAKPASPQDLLMQELGKKIGIKFPGTTPPVEPAKPVEPATEAASAAQVASVPANVATSTVPAPPPQEPAPAPKVKDIGKEIKQIGKDLKKIFKF